MPKPTHFLCLPLNQTSSYPTPLSSFGSSLANSNPPIKGLDASIIIRPERLHLTLGVMALQAKSEKSISQALALLTSLKGPVHSILSAHGNKKLQISFNEINVMKLFKGGSAHVLYAALGPSGNPLLVEVGELVLLAFRKEGFVLDTRPLKLHCTLINTIYRKPNKSVLPAPVTSEATSSVGVEASRVIGQNPSRSADRTHHGKGKGRRKERIPFSLTDLLSSPELDSFVSPEHSSSEILDRDRARQVPLPVNLGTYHLSSIQLCEMGSYDTNGGYRSIGGIDLI